MRRRVIVGATVGVALLGVLAVAVVLGDVSRGAGVTPETERMAVCALGVKGVPRICLEEALWSAAETLYTDASA